ncbi:inactive dipeptidyl peptidase 10 isoform X2 [Onthophagus taurus]|uniref:inactive dipeptidyl peptidase 10 isoform X2 n=1 Tax=Onthophagus taurus TaxID=166361 RepID=UPI0039BDC005
MDVEQNNINKVQPKNGNKTSGKNSINRVKIVAPYAYVEELVVSSPNERNWRGIFIALLVIVAVLGLIVFSIVLVSPPEEGSRVKGEKPTLEDIYLKLPEPAKFNGTWISDTEFVYRDIFGGISIYNAENLTTSTFLTNTTFVSFNNRQYNVVDFRTSRDLKFVLLITDLRHNFDYSTFAQYYILEVSSGYTKPLSPKELDDSAPFLKYATWSTNGTSIAFVHNNDIYYKPKVQKDLVCRITSTGGEDIFNGVPDWIYETEILKTDHTLWFSPDGLYLMYATFNDSKVGEYTYTWYDSGNPKAKYPEVKSIKYPKVESNNPEVTVWIVNLSAPKYLFPVQLKPTSSVENGSYLTSASFYGDHDVALVWLNRRQNVSVILSCRAQNNFNCTDFHVEKETCGWTEPIFHPVFSNNGTQALARLPVRDGNNGHYMHVCQIYDYNVLPLTHGAFEITKILAWDEESHIIYAIATNEKEPAVRHLFKVGDYNSTQPWTCLTCRPQIDFNKTFDADYFNTTMYNNSLMAHYKCDYNNVIFSHAYKYYIQECLGPNVPVVFLVETSTNFRIAVLNFGTNLQNEVIQYAAPQIKRISVILEDEYQAQVKLFLPPVLREYEEVVFPTILYIDSKPGAQSVTEKWDASWAWFLASTRNYIVAYVDVRGSGYQGEKMKREILNKIGSTDVQDQLAVLSYFRNELKYVDKTKICVVGRGYGGYISAMMLMIDIHQVINCSVSISPITDWYLYNSYFTERYLGIPSQQFLEYEKADLTKRASNMRGKHFLLIHGTADTTVKPQHSMRLARSLIDYDILFRQLVYPDESHTFSKKGLMHMYKEIDQFFNESFGPSLDDWEENTGFFMQ